MKKPQLCQQTHHGPSPRRPYFLFFLCFFLGGPEETTMLTLVPLARVFPGPGLVEITKPLWIFFEDFLVVLPTEQFSARMAALASARGAPARLIVLQDRGSGDDLQAERDCVREGDVAGAGPGIGDGKAIRGSTPGDDGGWRRHAGEGDILRLDEVGRDVHQSARRTWDWRKHVARSRGHR